MNKIILGMIAIKACWDMIHLISCHHLLIFQSSYQPMMTAYYCETWYIFAVIVWMMWSVWVIDKDWGSCGCVTLPHSSHLRLRPGSPLWPPRPAHASVRRRPQTALSGAQGRTLWRPADQRIIIDMTAECSRMSYSGILYALKCLCKFGKYFSWYPGNKCFLSAAQIEYDNNGGAAAPPRCYLRCNWLYSGGIT